MEDPELTSSTQAEASPVLECLDPLLLHSVDLNRVVEDALRVFRRTANGNIEWQPGYCTRLPSVLADGEVLGQVISHLLVNALDAMPQGGRVTLTTESLVLAAPGIRSEPAARPGQFVCLTIRDTGCGIPATQLSRIFEPLFTTTEACDRSGLGLAIVYGIVKQHHGWTEVTSQLGQGTAVKIFLPAITAPVVLAAATRVDPEPPGLSAGGTQLLPEPERGVRVSFVKEASTTRAVFSVNMGRSEPLSHWGINE